MKKGILLFTLFIIALNTIFSQTDRVQNIHSVKLTIGGISYSYEKAIVAESAVNFELMLAGAFGSDFLHGDYWLVAPVLMIEPRLYYNYNKRTIKGKRVINNAANYLSLSLDYQFGFGIGENAASYAHFSVVSKWGLRRALGNHFYFEGAAGPGVMATSPDNWSPFIGIDLKFGYVFNKRNKPDDKK